MASRNFLLHVLRSAILFVAMTMGSSSLVAAPPAKAAPAKAAATKSAPPVASNPFAGFPTAMDLPLPQSDKPNQPILLGPMAVSGQTICVVRLRGGNIATKGRFRFHLIPESEEVDNRIWNVVLRELMQDMGGQKVAVIELKDGKLWLTWAADAAEQPNASYLINCGLSLAAGQATHQVSFRKTIRVAPLILQMDDESTSMIEIPNAPANNQIKVEFTLLKDLFPKFRFIGKSTLAAHEDSTWVEFGLKKSEQGTRLKIETDLSNRGLRIRVTPYFQTVADTRPVRLTAESIKRAEGQLKQVQDLLNSRLKLVRESDGDKKKGKSGKDSKNSTANTLESQLVSQLAKVRQAMEQLNIVRETQKKLDGSGKIHFRAFVSAEDLLIDLASTQAGKPANK